MNRQKLILCIILFLSICYLAFAQGIGDSGTGITKPNAPRNATYITQTPNDILTNEQALSSTLTQNYLPKWSTSSLVNSLIYDDGTFVGIRTTGGLIIGEDIAAGTANVAGLMKLISAGDNAFYTTFTTGTQTANIGYTLPTALPTANSLPLISSTTGAMSWSGNFGANDLTTTGTLGAGVSTLSTVNFGGSTGVSATAASGVLTLGGIGGTNNENLTFDFETTSNEVIIGSGSAAYPHIKRTVSTAPLLKVSSSSISSMTANMINFVITRITTGNGLLLTTDTTTTSIQHLSSGNIAKILADNTLTTTSYTMAGNLLSANRNITYNKAANTLTVTGAVVDIQDSFTLTAGTITHTAPVLNLVQNYTSATGDVLVVTGKGSGDLLSLIDNTTEVFKVTDGGNVGIGNTAPAAVFVVNPPAAQTIAAGNTVTADACGTMKQITSVGAVTTDTTNTFTAPAAANTGCCMDVVNTGANAITLDANALFVSAGAVDVVLGAGDSCRVSSNGSKWYQIGDTGNN